MIADDIKLAKILFDQANSHPELQGLTNNLSICTLRYVPSDRSDDDTYLNALNEAILDELQKGGEAFCRMQL